MAGFITSFILGLLTPLTAVCVLPLYPGFLSFLAGKLKKGNIFRLGLITFLGVLTFMLILGILFTTILQVSLTTVIGIISPIAFVILAAISIGLIFGWDVGKYFPQAHAPLAKNPLLSAFVFGFFFGAIVIPCNPGFIAFFLARAILVAEPFASILHFLSFGFGLGFPLLLFSAVSSAWSSAVIGFLTKHKRKIDVTAGIIMLVIALYYLFFVFRVQEKLF